MSRYSITELSREFDVTPRAIRFYEDEGLLAPAREGPHGRVRVYNQRDRTRLKLTLRGKRLGLSLSQIRELVDMYESPKDTEPQLTRFLDVLKQHQARSEERLGKQEDHREGRKQTGAVAAREKAKRPDTESGNA